MQLEDRSSTWLPRASVAVLAALVAGVAAAQPFDPSFDNWTIWKGTWSHHEGVATQSSLDPDCRAFAPSADWRDYVYEVKAKKTGGREGFLIIFRLEDSEHFYWWNIAGWGNTLHAIETRPRTALLAQQPGKVETDRWHDIKIVLKGDSIKCYLDGELIHDIQDSKYPRGGVGLGSWVTAVQYKDMKVTPLAAAELDVGGPVVDPPTFMPPDLYAKKDTWAETMLALRARIGDHRQATGRQTSFDPWRKLHADFPLEVEQMQQTLPTEALSAWFDSSENADLERRVIAEALDDLGKDAGRAREAFEDLIASKAPPDSPRWLDLFSRICAELRAASIRRCPPVAFIKRAAQARKGTNATMLGQLNLGAQMGSSICIYDPARPGQRAGTILESEDGFIFDMSPSYDARKLIFSFMEHVREGKDSFHIWEINADGSGLRQLTTGPYHDASPAYLPDGRIVFCSTRVESFSLCQDFLAAALYVMDADGGNVHRIEYTTLCDTTPFVMDDGSILFGRWEYQDKNIFCVQGLWTIQPDGAALRLHYGNTLTIPNSIHGAKQIPGTRKVVCVMAPHHGRPLGAIGLIDRGLGFENPKAMVNLTPEIPYQPIVADAWHPLSPNQFWAAGDIQYHWAYGDPWPIAEDLFLVSYGGPIDGGPKRYRLFLLDDCARKIHLYSDPSASCFNPVPLRPRPLPHRLPRRGPSGGAENDAAKAGEVSGPRRDSATPGYGFCFVTDIYQELVDKGVKRGQIKRLRIMSQVPKKWNTEGPRYHDHYPAIGQGSYYPKVNYGTVPVYEDGTAHFRAPAGVELYFIALDADGKEIRRMGTTTQLMPGERQGCVGCHASRPLAPPHSPAVMKRLAGEPDVIMPPPWGAGPVGFVKQVQPVLDRYCVKCHEGRAPAGGIDLSGDKSRLYNMAYRSLLDKGWVEHYYINQGPTGNFQPLASGSWVSKLTALIEADHHGVEMDDESRRRIYCWIDANAPYYETWDMSRPHTMGGRDTWMRLKAAGQRGPTEPESWYAEYRRTFDEKCLSCHADENPNNAAGTPSYAWINLTRPEFSRALNAHLGKGAGGLGLSTAKDGKPPPLLADTNSPTYRAMLSAIQAGKQALDARPRIDMAGGVAVPQQRDFGRLY